MDLDVLTTYSTFNHGKDKLMPEEMKAGCARPTGGPVGESVVSEKEKPVTPGKEKSAMIMVGKKAPDFSAPAFFKGKFINAKLSGYLGKWVVLCCYPGDFTFV